MLTACPTDVQLHAFATGEPDLRNDDQIAQHLMNCPRCEDKVASYDVHALALASQFCVSQAHGSYVDEPEMQLALQRVGTLEELSADFHPQQRPCGAEADLQRLGEYDIIARIGAGAMGVVYKASHRRLKRLVALKVLDQRRWGDRHAASRFGREMRAVGKLNHPHVIQASDAGEIDGMHYLAMQFIDGLDLGRIVTRLGPLRVCDACEVIRQAADGLEYARRNGIVHRDIKPSNLIIDRRGQVRVADLGLALFDSRHDDHVSELTSDGQVMGTLEYMAPEQLNDSHNVTTQADVYSLGATLYRLLTGRTPIIKDGRHTALERIRAIAVAEPTPIDELRPDLPVELTRMISKMLSRDQHRRPATPGHVAAWINGYTRGNELASLVVEAETQRADGVEASTQACGDPGSVTARLLPSSGSPERVPVGQRYALVLGATAAVLLVIAGSWFIAGPKLTGESKPAGTVNSSQELSADHRFAKWVIDSGGSVTMFSPADPAHGWKPRTVNDLPDDSYHLTNAILDGVSFEKSGFRLIGQLHHLTILRMAYSNVSDDDLTALTDLPLSRLELTGTNITSRGIANLGNLPVLSAVQLDETAIDDEALKSLSQRKSLQEISVAGTKIGDDGIRYLASLPELESLSVMGTEVTDRATTAIEQIKSLKRIKAWGTKMSEPTKVWLHDKYPPVSEHEGENETS